MAFTSIATVHNLLLWITLFLPSSFILKSVPIHNHRSLSKTLWNYDHSCFRESDVYGSILPLQDNWCCSKNRRLKRAKGQTFL